MNKKIIFTWVFCILHLAVYAKGNEANLIKLENVDRDRVNHSLLTEIVMFEELFIDKVSMEDVNNFADQHVNFPICAFSDRVLGSINSYSDNSAIRQWFIMCAPKNAKEMLISNTYAEKSDKKYLIEQWNNRTDLPLKFEDFFFSNYRNEISNDRLLRKIDKLIYNKQIDLANYHSQFVNESNKKDIALKIRLFSDKEKFESMLAKNNYLTKYPIVQIRKLNLLIKRDLENEALKQLNVFKGYEEEGWKPRHALARNLIRQQKYKQAYKIALNHGLVDGENYQDAEWILGWISYQYLKDYKLALHHFKNLYENSNYYTTKSKASYWIWKTYLNLNDHKSAAVWYEEILRSPAHFYSQIAIAETKKAVSAQALEELVISEENYDKIKYANIYWAAGIKGYARNIIRSIEYDNQKGKTVTLASKPYPLRVAVAKNIANRYGVIVKTGYPDIKIKNNLFRTALYWGIIRQESEFDQAAVSSAGAVGMMQLMPQTAMVCAKALSIDKNDFKKSAEKNVEKGTYYLNCLIEKYGNIIAAIAAYNAGEKPVNAWIESFGNPKDFSSRDEYVHWIESIPYSETRLYVKKVLENMFTYEIISNKNFTPSEFLLKDYVNYKLLD